DGCGFLPPSSVFGSSKRWERLGGGIRTDAGGNTHQHDHVSVLWLRAARVDARERVCSLLRVHQVPSAATPSGRRLLCVLLVWLSSLSAASTGGRHVNHLRA